jgi:hypothetical protein
MKQSKSFRLSVQAQENLRQLVTQTGSSETAIIEIALAKFAKFMQQVEPDFYTEVPEPDFPPEFFDDIFSGKIEEPITDKPARRRHKSR